MTYSTFVFDSSFDKSKVPVAPINCFHWEEPHFSRPPSFAKLWGVKGEGIYAELWSFESNILCRYTHRDEPIWCDSCLELFLAPVQGDSRYMNFEVNPQGAYLSQFGKKREGRVFIKELTALEPVITPLHFSQNGKEAWGCRIFLPDDFIATLYGVPYTTAESTLRGNFYKCADESISPHYGAFFPVGSTALGFHNPACFGNIILADAK